MALPGSPRTRMRPIGPCSPMRSAPCPRSRLAGGRSDRSGLWLSRVWMIGPALVAKQADQRRHGRDDRLEPRDIVAERVAEAALLDEVPLHVDHDERGLAGREGVGIGLGRDGDHGAARWRAGNEDECGIPSPLAGEGGSRRKRETDEGSTNLPTPARPLIRRCAPPSPARGEGESPASPHPSAPPCGGRWWCGRSRRWAPRR